MEKSMIKNELHSNHISGSLISDFLKRGCNSVVECKLPKLDVAGSNPVARFGLTEGAV